MEPDKDKGTFKYCEYCGREMTWNKTRYFERDTGEPHYQLRCNPCYGFWAWLKRGMV